MLYEVITRLKDLFLTLVVVCAALYLLEVWYIYDSMAGAWSALLSLGFTLADVPFTVSKLLLIVLVLYVSIVASWVIRSVLEAEVFPRQRFDRGVRDSIKKLLRITSYNVCYTKLLRTTTSSWRASRLWSG